MINAAEAIVGGSMWASMTSCLTPTVLFCILNLTIVTIFITSSLEKPHELGDDEDESPPKLIRVKSINFSTYSSEQPYPFDSAASHATAPPQEPTHLQKSECVEESHVNRSRSDTSVNVPERRVLKKSASEKVFAAERQEEEDRLRPATVRETTSCNGTEEEEVDAKADDFINRFRQQLKLQRMESNLRYQEMTNRLRN
ncbi:uncharacterized protein LOC111397967 [Olea europaea var. sylvestris]|uniref:uncharacterized protein LOC111397967 n=1 Tax=Olea europaea var. sylvestris TaxID=158386 RepID=UPI000C1D538C|nr:uncharacterized protein LOC111397967 [Olea europaea var. sylvestris]